MVPLIDEGDLSKSSAAPLPVLQGEDFSPWHDQKMPAVVTTARILAVVAFCVFVVGAMVNAGQSARVSFLDRMVNVAIWGVFAAIQVWLFVELGGRTRRAWRLQAFLGVVAATFFLIPYIVVVYRWWDPETRAWFGVK